LGKTVIFPQLLYLVAVVAFFGHKNILQQSCCKNAFAKKCTRKIVTEMLHFFTMKKEYNKSISVRSSVFNLSIHILLAENHFILQHNNPN